MASIDKGEGFLIAFGGSPQQNVVSFLVGDLISPGKTPCPASLIDSGPGPKKFPEEPAVSKPKG